MGLITENIKSYMISKPESTYLGLEKIFGISLNVILKNLGIDLDCLSVNRYEYEDYLTLNDKRGNVVISEIICGVVALRINYEYDHLNRLIRKYDNYGHEIKISYSGGTNNDRVVECSTLLSGNSVLRNYWLYELDKRGD